MFKHYMYLTKINNTTISAKNWNTGIHPIIKLTESTWNQKSMECCEPTVCLSKRDTSIHNIQHYFWKIQDGGRRLFYFVEWAMILLRTVVIHADSSFFQLYLITQYIKVECMEPEEFWSPMGRLTFESWSPAR